MELQDTGYFYDGFGIEGEAGDLIQFEGQKETARIKHIDAKSGKITLDRPLSWKDGQGVALAYSGKAPDIGTFEQGESIKVGATGALRFRELKSRVFEEGKMSRRSDHEELSGVVTAFVRWLKREGYFSYDPYDVWGTKYGLAARRLYYATPWLGLPLVAPILLLDVLCPALAFLVRAERNVSPRRTVNSPSAF